MTIHKTPLTYTMTILKTQLLNRLNLGAPSPSPGSVSSSDPLRVTRCSRQPGCPPWPRSKAAEPSPSNLRLSPGFSRESWLKDQNRRRDDGRTCLAEKLSLICLALVAVSISCSSSTACQFHRKYMKMLQKKSKKERNSSWNTFDQLTNTLVWTR